MSNSYASKNQCSLKREIAKVKREHGFGQHAALSMHSSEMHDPTLMALNEEFWKGPIRYGNKRHYEAAMKVKTRRSARQKSREEVRDLVKTEVDF